MIGLIPAREPVLIEQPLSTSSVSPLTKIVDILKEGDGHFVLAVGSNSDWVAFISMDNQEDDSAKWPWGTGNSAHEAIDKMLGD